MVLLDSELNHITLFAPHPLLNMAYFIQRTELAEVPELDCMVLHINHANPSHQYTLIQEAILLHLQVLQMSNMYNNYNQLVYYTYSI